MSEIAAKPATTKTSARRLSIKINIGNMTVRIAKPNAEQVEANVAISTLALERVAKRLRRPGVRLNAKKNVPLYSADPDRPGRYIRSLNGRVEHGVFESGAFKVAD
jgi:hypothetical protein